MRESTDNNLDVTFIAEREIRNYELSHPGQHISSDINTLISMGFDKKMINKTYILLRPPNIERAIDYMTEINGIIQHNFLENKAGIINKNLCYICKKPRKKHLGYVPGLFPDENDNIKSDDIMKIKSSEDSTCKVCFESIGKKEKKYNSIPCGHLCCTACWVNYLETLISEAKVEEIKCVEHKCNQILEEKFIIKHIKQNKKLLVKYEKFKNRAQILKDPNKKICPEPNCESYLEKSTKTKYVRCKEGHNYCFECLKPPHGKSTCESILEKEFLLYKKDKVIKRCPKCKIYTEKNEGCNHMTCSSCKYQWCWLCEGQYSYGHYDTGRCKDHQFTKANSIDEAENNRKNDYGYNYTNNYNTFNNSYNNNLYNTNRYNNNIINTNSTYNYNNNLYNTNRYNNNLINNNSNSNNDFSLTNNINNLYQKKNNKYFKDDEEEQNCCCSLSSIFPYCLHKVNYLKEDIDGYERLNALFIWFFGYFLFVAYQVYNSSRDDFCQYNSFRKVYIFFGMLISFCLFICYQILFTALITPFILICMVYPFFIYKIKMFFTIGNAHYYNKTTFSTTTTTTYTNTHTNILNNIKTGNKYFKDDEKDQNCCCSLSSIFPYCLHKVNYLKEDIDGYERLNALFIWFFGYFLFVAYQVYNSSKDDFCQYNSFRKVYIFFGMLISFCLYICYQILFTALITPFILICMVYPFFIYKIKMFFTIGNAHYYHKTTFSTATNTTHTTNNKIKSKKTYFKYDDEEHNCCCSLSSIFPYCLHKVDYIKDDIDGFERLNALFIWFFGYFLFVAYQVYNSSRDDFCQYNSFRKVYIFFGMIISFCLFICYQILFTALITPFILICMVYPFFIYKIKMFFTIGNAHYFDNRKKSLLKNDY